MNLGTETDVQLTYNQNVFNIRLYFSNGIMKLLVIDGNDAVSGLGFELDNTTCQTFYSDLVNEIPFDKLSDNFYPLIIYKFISEFNGVVLTEAYDSQKNCRYVSRQISGSFVTFEVFENEENYAYSIHIT